MIGEGKPGLIVEDQDFSCSLIPARTARPSSHTAIGRRQIQ